MRSLFCALLLVHAIAAFKPPTIAVDEPLQIQEHSSIGKFIELEEHDQLILKCSGRFDDLKFTFPNLEEHVGFDRTSFEDRIEEYIDDDFGDTVLKIDDVRESDTGTYSCISEEHDSLNDTIHVFVHGSKLFVPLKSIGFQYNEGEVMVPCKTTKFIEKNDIELSANNALIKSASKNYDQRYGFKITNKMYDVKPFQNIPFECKYKKDRSQEVDYLITEKEPVSSSDYYFYWDKGMEWPYVGYNFSITCHLVYNGTKPFPSYENHLYAECPQCSHDVGSHAFADSHRLKSNRISVTVRIADMSLEDSGNFRCIWNHEKLGTKIIDKEIHVSPNRAQIKVLERSPQIIRQKETHPTTLHAKFAIYPIDEAVYEAKWSRTFNSSIKDGPQSEIISSNSLRRLSTATIDKGIFLETLEIDPSAMTANMSGTYVLSISLLNTRQVVQWEMAIENPQPDVQITIREPSSFIVFNQQFYPPDTTLHIDCVSISIPPADVIFEQRTDKDSEFEPIDPNQLIRVDGTFETGFIWNVTLEKDIDIKCSSERNGKVSSKTKSIIVAEEAPKVYFEIEKNRKATKSESQKQIFEGDTVKLFCIVPSGVANWNVFWKNNGETLESETEVQGHSKRVVLSLRDVTTESTGKYTCVVKNENDDSENSMELSVTVEKTVKPHHTNAESMAAVVVQYDHSFVLDCTMTGIPAPEYQWFKDGNHYHHGISNGSLLTVPRSRAEDNGQFHCLATNRAGSADNYMSVQVKGAPKSSSSFFWLIFIVLIICIVALVFFAYKLRLTKNVAKQKDIALRNLYETMLGSPMTPLPEDMKELPIEERTYYLPYNTDYNIARENLEILETLGKGNFGEVRKGLLQMADPKSQIEYKTRLTVAVKSCSRRFDIEQQQMLAEELKVMCAIPKHPNVLALVGAVTANMRKGELLIVTEFIDGGNLKDFLRNHASVFRNELVPEDESSVDDSYMVPNSVKKKTYKFEEAGVEHERLLVDSYGTLCTSDLLSIGLQIANGMEWLASIPCVHRDLACRNVLLTRTKIVRIADFGLAKKHSNKTYYTTKKSKDAPIPVRWMPLEAIDSQKFTQKSDVWSFGICLFEIFTLGGNPYPNCQNLEVYNYIKEGKRNAQPEYCHDDVYELMKMCWQPSPKNRPTFTECVQFFKNHMQESAAEVLERVDQMLHVETEEQAKLSEWIETSRPTEHDNNFRKPVKKPPTDERYLIVESHA